MFVDRIKVFAQAGKGGRGSVSFRREKFVPKGGPDGGDGGHGGDVVLRAERHVDNLANLFYEPIIKAKDGGHGKGKKMAGRAGANKVVKVPVGTIVWRAEDEKFSTSNADKSRAGAQQRTPGSDQSAIRALQSEMDLIVDLVRDGEEFVLCRGGAGGKGNVHFKSSRNRAPRQYTDGEEGEQGYFLLELRTIADAGLVGYPNAGKSTLLRKLSAARPKVAAYPFTTLHPVVGVMELPGYRHATIADIPGLIEGAHRGVGLGHEFLRHITRCPILIFVIDVAGSEGRSPVEDLQNLRKEIDLYDPMLSSRPWLIVANKMDLPNANENLETLQEKFSKVRIVPISAANGEGIDTLKKALAERMTGDQDISSPINGGQAENL
ncbi:MAG: GTPase ObgE [Verrucomicrobia bacterium 13_1_20CM_4_54_11]|nr:MAG: GTPase ObgE [Verrucomicrobia bacterium 13_1_20CM_4_54_11]